MIRTIYFGGGCFWCVESIYLKINGVVDVKPGYMGGSTINPTYEEVCEGNTDHVEVAKVMRSNVFFIISEFDFNCAYQLTDCMPKVE